MAHPDPSLGLIVLTGPHCQLRGQACVGIPTLVWPDGVDEVVSDWLRTQVVDYGIAASSAHEYAKLIRPFRRFCRQHHVAWQSVSDDFLVLWREHLSRTVKASVGRVNASLKTVFAFYCWAEENKYIRYRVGIYADDELPAVMARVTFPISAKRVFSKGRHGRIYGSWTTPLTLSQPQQSVHVRHTPTEDEIRKLHRTTVERRNGERDSLIFSWAEETGLRRAEILQVGKAHMPTMDQLSALVERDEYWPVVVRRKGGRSHAARVPPDLILRTLDYVEYGRSDIVETCRRNVGYREPDAIFLSSRTGRPLHPDSVTTIGRRAFRKAGVARANIHRLRARYAVRMVEAQVDAMFGDRIIGSESAWVETILVRTAESMGHVNPRSLRPYLTYVLDRRLQTAEGPKSDRLAARVRQLEFQEDALVRRLQHQSRLQSVASDMKAGRDKVAASSLRALADELDQRGLGCQTPAVPPRQSS